MPFAYDMPKTKLQINGKRMGKNILGKWEFLPNLKKQKIPHEIGKNAVHIDKRNNFQIRFKNEDF